MSINKVILIGNLGGSPELRYTAKEKPFCHFSVATDHTFTGASEERQSRTEWHQIVCFGVTAQNCAKFLKKGRQVFVEGRIQSQRWQDKDGIDRVTHRVVAANIQFLGARAITESEASTLPDTTDAPFSSDTSEDIPW